LRARGIGRSLTALTMGLMFLLVFLVHLIQVSTVHSWGSTGHQLIENKAERVFSDNSFFSSYHSTLYTWVLYPDQTAPGGGRKFGQPDWHYLDGYSYDPLVYTDGELPWAVENIFENLVGNLMDDNWNNSAQLMGAICHFTGDSTQPLHSTWNYNPGGNHGYYESTELNNHLGEISIPDNYVPQELDNVLAAALASLAKSFSYTREGANPGDNNLTDFLDNDNCWNDWIKSMTENRLRAAVQFTANIWYSAMIRAGLTIPAPVLLQPENNASVTSAPTLTWTSVYGTSAYDLQLASDINFTTNVTTIKGLAENSRALENSLAEGTWYWHVRSGDNSTHVGLWSQTRQFNISAGRALFSLVTLSKVGLDIDLYLDQGSKLIVKFYDYENNYENEVAIDNFIPPWHIVENENVTHPSGIGVKKAKLWLVDSENNEISKIKGWETIRDDLWGRLIGIRGEWPYASVPERDNLWNELMGIRGQWPYAPTTRDPD